jgi:hypothetical protein
MIGCRLRFCYLSLEPTGREQGVSSQPHKRAEAQRAVSKGFSIYLSSRVPAGA